MSRSIAQSRWGLMGMYYSEADELVFPSPDCYFNRSWHEIPPRYLVVSMVGKPQVQRQVLRLQPGLPDLWKAQACSEEAGASVGSVRLFLGRGERLLPDSTHSAG